MQLSGYLTLIPTPIFEALPLEPVALDLLKQHSLDEQTLLLVEEHKVARQRWMRWGLPREAIDRFILFNEHTQEKQVPELIAALKSGKRAYLMSDGGLPAFYDPGQELVNACHENKVKVTATPFPNSIALAIALSGFSHQEFHFAGFLPANADDRKRSLERLSQQKSTLVLMDTPYRLQALLKDLAQSALKGRLIFLGTGLNSPEEKLFRGTPSAILNEIGSLNKVEFVLVINSVISRQNFR